MLALAGSCWILLALAGSCWLLLRGQGRTAARRAQGAAIATTIRSRYSNFLNFLLLLWQLAIMAIRKENRSEQTEWKRRHQPQPYRKRGGSRRGVVGHGLATRRWEWRVVVWAYRLAWRVTGRHRMITYAFIDSTSRRPSPFPSDVKLGEER